LQNNNDEKDGEVVYGRTLTAKEIDYIESRSDAEAWRSRKDKGNPLSPVKGTSTQGRSVKASSRVSARGRAGARTCRRIRPSFFTEGTTMYSPPTLATRFPYTPVSCALRRR
jgi:hypothetical protein